VRRGAAIADDVLLEEGFEGRGLRQDREVDLDFLPIGELEALDDLVEDLGVEIDAFIVRFACKPPAPVREWGGGLDAG
jgi:hypothetical protein